VFVQDYPNTCILQWAAVFLAVLGWSAVVCVVLRLWVKCGIAESKMWNQKCGMTLIGRGDKPRDRWLSADYHTSLSTSSMVKCRPEVRKSLAMEADSIV